MEYTSGLPLNDFVVNDSPVFCQKIISTLLRDRQTCKFPHNELKLKNKIETISSSLKNDNKLLFECKKKLIQLYTIDWPDLELSFCNGNLTFKNKIIKNDEIYLIDFLDSFIDNYLIDASKLVMDLIIGWSWRHSDKVPYVKNSIILSNIYKMFSDQEVDIINKFKGLLSSDLQDDNQGARLDFFTVEPEVPLKDLIDINKIKEETFVFDETKSI